jgi:hypothetical protein
MKMKERMSKLNFMEEIALTKEEREIKAWAGKAFREPWFELVRRCAKIKSGEELSDDEIWLHPFFVNVLVDVRLVCKSMQTLKVSKFVSGNLFTIILSKKEDKVIWACVEKEQDGVFVSAHTLDVTERWADKMAELLFIDNMKGAYELACDVAKKKEIADSIGAIKVANIMFFKTIKDAYEKSGDGKNLPLFLFSLLDAVKTNVDRKWIRFFPDVPLAKIIRFSYPLVKYLAAIGHPVSRILSLKPVDSMIKAYYSYLLPIKVAL